jgi:hypothetical protein
MAKRLATKHKKMKRDQARAYSESAKEPWDHKVARARSKKALKKKAYPMT